MKGLAGCGRGNPHEMLDCSDFGAEQRAKPDQTEKAFHDAISLENRGRPPYCLAATNLNGVGPIWTRQMWF